jgi:uncharacterized membrane protein YkgB
LKTIKIILGIIIAIAAINVMITMASKESGAGLAGAVTSFIIFEGIAGWLIYSGLKKK